MKICVIGLRGIPGVGGGVETHCEQLLPRLRHRRSEDEFVVVARRQYVPSQPYQFEGLQVVPLRHLHGKYLEAISSAFVGVVYAAFVARANMLHIHAIGPALFAPAARLLGLKVIVTHHSENYDHSKWNRPARFVLRMGERAAMYFADRVIVVSPSLTQKLIQNFPSKRSKITFIPNGANHLAFENSDSTDVLERFDLIDRPFIVSVGRIVPEKGFHDLVAAFDRSGWNGKLVIVGGADDDDPYWQNLKSAASSKVVFTGYMQHADVAVLLRHASLFVLPSHNEGLSIAALEAVTAGASVLLSDIQPNVDLGLPPENYYPVGDVEALAHKLTSDHEQYRAPAEEILARYDWEAVADATSKVYSDAQA
ncbi:glycosyltransferase family 4 protein [Afifella sp. IM 167]|uniref:glycosyltransferase family 4 protein n=1 Tax=Afifella sp. IM 167 TaxID=2033586 RepID=UPI001CCB7021|nr:glycosyltransferase family 4 protein [Afifella sp. IM 167]MBZ8133280.1 glycosyl transferase [Afifella sp. IM 167]